MQTALGLAIGPVFEFAQQPALAQARLADDGERGEIAFAAQPAEGLLQLFQFGVAADHFRVHALDAARGHRKARGLARSTT